MCNANKKVYEKNNVFNDSHERVLSKEGKPV